MRRNMAMFLLCLCHHVRSNMTMENSGPGAGSWGLGPGPGATAWGRARASGQAHAGGRANSFGAPRPTSDAQRRATATGRAWPAQLSRGPAGSQRGGPG